MTLRDRGTDTTEGGTDTTFDVSMFSTKVFINLNQTYVAIIVTMNVHNLVILIIG